MVFSTLFEVSNLFSCNFSNFVMLVVISILVGFASLGSPLIVGRTYSLALEDANYKQISKVCIMLPSCKLFSMKIKL